MHAQTQQKIITTFLRWADGLETESAWRWADRGVVLILGTNLAASVDPAIADRARLTAPHFSLHQIQSR